MEEIKNHLTIWCSGTSYAPQFLWYRFAPFTIKIAPLHWSTDQGVSPHIDMSPILICEWIESTKKAEGNPGAGSGDWAIQKVIDLSTEGCWDQVWDFILGVTASTDSEWVLSCLGAGPLEDLLCSKCAEYIDRVADCAKRSVKFKKALRSVWLDSGDTPLFGEIYKIAGVEPPFD